MYALGISIGGNVLMSYVGEMGDKCELKALVTIANPFDLEKCSEMITRWHKWLYHQNMLNGFKKNFLRNKEQLLKNNNFDLDKVEKSANIEEFDANFTIKVHGFPTTQEYYKYASCKKCIHEVKIPTLCIHSRDDPVVHNSIIPIEELKRNENIILVETQRGGHIDWFTTRYARRWVFWPAIEFMLAVQQLNEIKKEQKEEEQIKVSEPQQKAIQSPKGVQENSK